MVWMDLALEWWDIDGKVALVTTANSASLRMNTSNNTMCSDCWHNFDLSFRRFHVDRPGGYINNICVYKMLSYHHRYKMGPFHFIKCKVCVI